MRVPALIPVVCFGAVELSTTLTTTSPRVELAPRFLAVGTMWCAPENQVHLASVWRNTTAVEFWGQHYGYPFYMYVDEDLWSGLHESPRIGCEPQSACCWCGP